MPILPVGTQVVSRADLPATPERPAIPTGTVGVVVRAPADAAHAYRVRFPDGFEGSYRRDELVLLRHWLEQGLTATAILADHDLTRHIVYRCVMGSRAFGLDEDASDTDRRGCYLPPADLHWSLYGVPEQIEDNAHEEVYWELQKFLNLALKANPNILECLWSPLVDHVAPIGEELLAIRCAFLSKLVYQTYNGYVASQFKKLEADLRNQGAIKPKHAMHLIRLLLSGIGVLETGELTVRVHGDRDRLLAIKRGDEPWDRVNDWRLALHRRFEQAFATSRLPDHPDYATVNAFLIRARRSAL
ncbi:MAG TPA: nucleotidyltransferase domain-containing protein [Planctomycetota bacterium]|nr:nucleotidyltransferase domain-containing protein [Planctomycetota bacterium]